MDSKTRKSRELQIGEQAAQWLDTLSAADEKDRAAFVEWLLESQAHLEQFLLLSAVNRMGPTLQSLPLDIDSLMRNASAEVLELPGAANTAVDDAGHRGRASRARRTLPWGLAAGVAIAIAGSAAVWLQQNSTRLETDVAEQRVITLPEGSTVRLSAQSRIRIRFNASQREIELESGEALFNAAHDPARPFRVRTGTAVIEALGTQFDVRRRASGTAVAVLEGAVRVAAVGGLSAPIRLDAGEDARVSHQGQIERRVAARAPAEPLLQPRTRLSFDEDTLEDIAADFNRFNRTPKLRIDSESLAQKRFTGTFNADDPLSLIAFLRAYTPVEVVTGDDEIVIRSR